MEIGDQIVDKKSKLKNDINIGFFGAGIGGGDILNYSLKSKDGVSETFDQSREKRNENFWKIIKNEDFFGKTITLTGFSAGGIKIIDFIKYLSDKGLRLKNKTDSIKDDKTEYGQICNFLKKLILKKKI